MPEEKKPARNFVRLETQLQAQYEYDRFNKAESGTASIVDISGGGLKMISAQRVKEGVNIAVSTDFADGPVTIKGTVLKSQLEWLITDVGKKTHWTTTIRFEGLDSSTRSRVINFVHRCSADIREAKINKKRP